MGRMHFIGEVSGLAMDVLCLSSLKLEHIKVAMAEQQKDIWEDSGFCVRWQCKLEQNCIGGGI